MSSILDEIIAHTRSEVAARKAAVPPAELESTRSAAAERRAFREAISAEATISLIAELKRRSPSAGEIRPGLDPAEVACIYEAWGAAAVSCLTDERFFGGSMGDLGAVRAAVDLPLLRKDFVIDEYQISEAKAYGADAVLLIAAALSEPDLIKLRSACDSCGLDALVEVHDSTELKTALGSGASLVGVNNRDLASFEVDLETSLRLADEIPRRVVKISESGIRTRADVERLEDAGFDGFLVGETLMRSDDIAAKVKELLGRG